jgi:hypothetical protein
VLKSHKVKEPNREHGEDDPNGAKTVTAPATVSGEVLIELCHWETGKAQSEPATREVRRPAERQPERSAPNHIGRTEGVHDHSKINNPNYKRFAARDSRRHLPVSRRFTRVPGWHVSHGCCS